MVLIGQQFKGEGMKNSTPSSLYASLYFQSALLFVLATTLLIKAYSSLTWRMEHDTPLLYYAAFMMDKHGLIPYRDIFETSMPGTFAFHY